MKRRELLKVLGAISLGSMLPGIATVKAVDKTLKAFDTSKLPAKYKGTPICWLTPQKTEGPYYFNANLVRSDIRISTNNGVFHDGIPLNMTFNIIDVNCNPIPSVMVDIWHCDKDGVYSGYNQPGGNYIGHNFMRGIQLTNSAGQCSFITSYPGWYAGRATHIHFKVRLNSTTYLTSQFCFPDATNNTIYATPLYVARGPNPITNAMDGIFGSAEPQYLIMYPTNNGNGTWSGTYTIGVAGASSINDPSFEADGYSLEQNYPNPFNPSTTIAYTIPVSSNVKLSIYDVFAKEVKTLVNKKQPAGRYEVVFDGTNFASGYYFYKLTAGDFVRSREMLLIK